MMSKWQPITNADQIIPGAKIRRTARDRAGIAGRPREYTISHREKPTYCAAMIVFTDHSELPLRDAKAGGWEIKHA